MGAIFAFILAIQLAVTFNSIENPKIKEPRKPIIYVQIGETRSIPSKCFVKESYIDDDWFVWNEKKKVKCPTGKEWLKYKVEIIKKK